MFIFARQQQLNYNKLRVNCSFQETKNIIEKTIEVSFERDLCRVLYIIFVALLRYANKVKQNSLY